jgi:hypothetical protein
MGLRKKGVVDHTVVVHQTLGYRVMDHLQRVSCEPVGSRLNVTPFLCFNQYSIGDCYPVDASNQGRPILITAELNGDYCRLSDPLGRLDPASK